MNAHLRQLHDAGVSIWLDTLSRELLESGEFSELVREYAVTGATSNSTGPGRRDAGERSPRRASSGAGWRFRTDVNPSEAERTLAKAAEAGLDARR